MRLSGKLVLALAIAAAAIAAFATVAVGQGDVSVSKPLIKRNGTAVLPVTFAKPGTAVLWDASTLRPCGGPPRIRRVQFEIPKPETDKFPVKPTKLIKPSLEHGTKVKVPVEVQFTPQGSTSLPETHTIQIALRISEKRAVRRCTPPMP